MNPKSSRRNSHVVTGFKAIVASASVAATIGGWALLADTSQDQVLTANSSVQVVNAQPAYIGLPPLNIAPLPTVVPAHDITVNGGQMVTLPAPQNQTKPQSNPNVQQSIPNASGNMHPFPFTITRSSR